MSLLNPDNEAAAVSLLLTLLPNLTSITLQDGTFVHETLSDIVQRVAEVNRDPSSSCFGQALAYLEEFKLERSDTEMSEDMNSYASFAMLPSMRYLQGDKVAGEILYWPPTFQYHSCAVTRIEISDGAISTKAFENLLSAITALKQFVYFHAGPIVGNTSYDPLGIIDILRSYAAHSLEDLNIEAHQNSISLDDDDLDDDGDHVGSMHIFCSLKTIRLEDHLFQIQYSDHMSGAAVPGDGEYDVTQAEDPNEPE